jgi:hypothetical protein
MLIRIRILPQRLQMLENLNLLYFIHSSASLLCLFFLVSVIGFRILNILDRFLNFCIKYGTVQFSFTFDCNGCGFGSDKMLPT